MKSLFGFSLFVLSSLCLPSCLIGFDDTVPLQLSADSAKTEDSVETSLKRRSPKESDPEKQLLCKEMGEEKCENVEGCEDICRDIFSRSSAKKKCLSLPSELVHEFQTIFELLDEGEDIRDISPKALECLLDIEESSFARQMGRLNRRETMDFLVEVAVNKKLGEVLGAEDDESLLLRKLFDNLDYAVEDLKKLAFPIDGQINVFELVLDKENEGAWDWLNSYVEEKCESSPLCYSEKKEEDTAVVFYCRLFLGMDSRGRLRSALSSRVFEDYFGHEIEREKVCGPGGDQNCELGYIDHFKSFCQAYTDETSL